MAGYKKVREALVVNGTNDFIFKILKYALFLIVVGVVIVNLCKWN